MNIYLELFQHKMKNASIYSKFKRRSKKYLLLERNKYNEFKIEFSD